ncbi:MAG: 8-amino-7-oxononanoate synthase [Planctomycetota bacterium]|jgi:8-amino-7-oxononanoate synthase
MEQIEKFLEQREQEGLMRVLRPCEIRAGGKICREGRELFDFSSNDYLGLSGDERLKEACNSGVKRFGTSSSASRLLSGDLKIFGELEERVAEFKGKESALVFNTGYQANVGIISAFCGRGDAVFCDRLSHASIIDGARQSGAKLFRFGHNDLGHLEELLEKEGGRFSNRLVVTESVFSMDGDKGAVRGLVELREKYGFVLLVDEAHATGVFGGKGSGVVEEEGVSEQVDLVMGTFSKALGSFGAYVACSKSVRDYLVNVCRSFIYSTALPPGVIAANIEALNIVHDEPFRRKELLGNAGYFRGRLAEAGLEVRGESQIVPVITGDNRETVRVSEEMINRGYWVAGIRPPTVPEGEGRLRFSLSYEHKREVLDKVVEEMIEITGK